LQIRDLQIQNKVNTNNSKNFKKDASPKPKPKPKAKPKPKVKDKSSQIKEDVNIDRSNKMKTPKPSKATLSNKDNRPKKSAIKEIVKEKKPKKEIPLRAKNDPRQKS